MIAADNLYRQDVMQLQPLTGERRQDFVRGKLSMEEFGKIWIIYCEVSGQFIRCKRSLGVYPL